MSDTERELRALVSELRAVLAYEEELGGPGLPFEPFELQAPVEVPVERPDDIVPRLHVLAEQAAACTACGLHTSRTKSVFSRGSASAELVFVGEGPGENEDRTGLPFVGAAGQLLDKMIAAMGFSADEVYICNVVKCRPPGNRTPQAAEADACAPFLVEQLELIKPKVIVALGRCAVENLGLMPENGRGWRGRWGTYRGMPAMSTYHPAFLLRSPERKRDVWEDLKRVLEAMGRKPRA